MKQPNQHLFAAITILLAVSFIAGAVVFVHRWYPRCDHCGGHVETTAHEYRCMYPGCGHQWTCSSGSGHYHCPLCKVVVENIPAHQKNCEFCGMTLPACQSQHKCPTGWSYKRSDPTSEKVPDSKPTGSHPRPPVDARVTNR